MSTTAELYRSAAAVDPLPIGYEAARPHAGWANAAALHACCMPHFGRCIWCARMLRTHSARVAARNRTPCSDTVIAAILRVLSTLLRVIRVPSLLQPTRRGSASHRACEPSLQYVISTSISTPLYLRRQNASPQRTALEARFAVQPQASCARTLSAESAAMHATTRHAACNNAAMV